MSILLVYHKAEVSSSEWWTAVWVELSTVVQAHYSTLIRGIYHLVTMLMQQYSNAEKNNNNKNQTKKKPHQLYIRDGWIHLDKMRTVLNFSQTCNWTTTSCSSIIISDLRSCALQAGPQCISSARSLMQWRWAWYKNLTRTEQIIWEFLHPFPSASFSPRLLASGETTVRM